ncbi:MAG TPA: hypothetical protein VG815_12525, partial [Chloroflexota bacterium]|nr:hypothetical protein [Chloroflexota bacterium]
MVLTYTDATLGPGSRHAPRRLRNHRYSLGNFTLESGVILPSATIAYATFGILNRDKTNAILVPSCTSRSRT